jgi:hypothetical protein
VGYGVVAGYLSVNEGCAEARKLTRQMDMILTLVSQYLIPVDIMKECVDGKFVFAPGYGKCYRSNSMEHSLHALHCMTLNP